MAESRLSIVIDSRNAEHKARDVQRALGALEQAGVRVTSSTHQTSSALDEQRQELEQLLGRIDPVVGRLGQLDKMEQQLRQHRKAGLLPQEDFDTYMSKLNQTRDAVGGYSERLEMGAMSAKQLQQAQRQLPMQFTDIFTSLAAGQPAMMVFLQQGGQIKDTFGGIGPATRAMGSYIMGLINPLTLATGGLAALVVAYEQGAAEQREFERTLTLLGNSAGITADELSDMASEMDGLSGTTTHRAAAALNTVAKSGKFTAEQYRLVTTTALEMQNAIGQAIDDTIDQFARIAEDPVSAIIELNNQYNFLTEDIYSQIRALQDSGDTVEAQRLAMETYSHTMRDRASEIAENLGWIEHAWLGIKTAAKEGWDAMLSVGRADTAQDRISELNREITRIQESMNRGISTNAGGQDRQRAALAALTTELGVLEAVRLSNELAADEKAKQNEREKESIDLQEEARKLSGRYQTDQQKINELLKERNTLEEAMAASSDEVAKERYGDSIRVIDDQIQSINESTEAYQNQSRARQEAARLAEKQEREAAREAERLAKAQQSLIDRLYPAQAAWAKYREEVEMLKLRAKTDETLDLVDALARLDTELSRDLTGGFMDQIATGGLAEDLEKTNDFAKDLGLTFTSAFEDAIVEGNNFRDVLAGIAEDIQRLLIRKSITEPAVNAIEGLDWGKLATTAAGWFTGGGSTGPALEGGFMNQMWTGGYTGDGGKYQPKGIVHGGEFVIQKSVVEKPGVRPMLERLNNMPGYATGGYVGGSSPSSSLGGTTVQIIDQRSGGAAPELTEQRGPNGMRQFRVLIRDEVRGMINDGSMDKTMARNYGQRRRPL